MQNNEVFITKTGPKPVIYNFEVFKYALKISHCSANEQTTAKVKKQVWGNKRQVIAVCGSNWLMLLYVWYLNINHDCVNTEEINFKLIIANPHIRGIVWCYIMFSYMDIERQYLLLSHI
jgi:hypothetical protein